MHWMQRNMLLNKVEIMAFVLLTSSNKLSRWKKNQTKEQISYFEMYLSILYHIMLDLIHMEMHLDQQILSS